MYVMGEYIENDKEFHGKFSKTVHDLFNNKYKGYIDTLDKPIIVDEIKYEPWKPVNYQNKIIYQMNTY